MKKQFILPALGLFLLASCGSETDHSITAQDGEVVSSISATNQSEEELAEELKEIRAEELRIEKERKESSTTMKFDKLKHDFGDVLQDSENTTVFTVTNTGDKPLIISDVSASCGCTTPKKPAGPIAPGESDIIEVTFAPKPGQKDEIKKTVTVTANTMDQVHTLEIRAFVK